MKRRPKFFIASAAEALHIATALQANLEHALEVTLWPQGVFKPSRTAIESLTKALSQFDAAAFVFSPEDVTIIRKRRRFAVRDNVIFELGLFIGRLGTERTFILMPKDMDALRLPTDLLGIQPVFYDGGRSDKNWQAAVQTASVEILAAMHGLVGTSALRAPAFPSSDLGEDAYSRLFRTLTSLAKPAPSTSLPSPWATDLAAKDRSLRAVLGKGKKEILVICYTFIIWKDRHEDLFLQFLRSGGRLRVLMAAPTSLAFLERSAMEAYEELPTTRPPHHPTWRLAVERRRDAQRSDLAASIAALARWRASTRPQSVQCRLYQDTPPLNGAWADGALFVSSYFASPWRRAFNSPALPIGSPNGHAHCQMLQSIFLNWFEVRFSICPDPLSAG